MRYIATVMLFFLASTLPAIMYSFLYNGGTMKYKEADIEE